jgi:hypothetical protein
MKQYRTRAFNQRTDIRARLDILLVRMRDERLRALLIDTDMLQGRNRTRRPDAVNASLIIDALLMLGMDRFEEMILDTQSSASLAKAGQQDSQQPNSHPVTDSISRPQPQTGTTTNDKARYSKRTKSKARQAA